MSLLLIAPNQDMKPLKDSLLKEDPNLDVEIWPNVQSKERVTFAVCWNHPSNVLGSYPNLTAVSSYGAGVNHLLEDKSLPENVKICRIVTAGLQEHIAEYVLGTVLNYRFHFSQFGEQKRKGIWEVHRAVPKEDSVIGILGMGELGKAIGKKLAENGYKIRGWSRSEKDINYITSFAGEAQLDEFLAEVNILICVLPLTPETEGILNLEMFKKLQKPAYIINIGRGKHLVEEDLIYALDTEILDGACLDVFEKEPLPENHPFWNRKNIFITPHVAGYVLPEHSASVIIENYKRALSGQELLHEVDRDRGY